MGNWVSVLDNLVYTFIKHKLQIAFSSKYPTLRVTNSSRSPTKAEFPSVYVQTIGNKEIGSTFDSGTNGISYDLQIEVNALEEITAREIMDFVVETLQEKFFRVTTNSLQNNTESTYGRVSRFSRTVGANDTF